MNAIGGFFELELRKGKQYHGKSLKFNTGRNCLEYIIINRKYKKIYIPYYTCEVILEPIQKLGVLYEFYSIDEHLNPIFNKILLENEAFLYTNYFGLKNDTIKYLSKIFGKQLIVDNAQAFFSDPVKDIDTFYSARKFFGVADGAYLKTSFRSNKKHPQNFTYGKMAHLLKRLDCSEEDAYEDFKKNEDELNNNPIMKMSKLTEAILSSIDYEKIKDIRRSNYLFYEKHLALKNTISLPLSEEVPLVYPFRTDKEGLRELLIENKIYVATYWPNVFNWCNKKELEYSLAKEIIPLPVDQRYNQHSLLKIIRMLQ